MAWLITCGQPSCGRNISVGNIVDLIKRPRDPDSLFVCDCGANAYIKKEFKLQESGDPWKPFLRGIFRLGTAGEIYQPFIFLVSYAQLGDVSDLWFAYYKDLRGVKDSHGKPGRLKMGYGPGGPPVLDKPMVRELITELTRRGYLAEDI